MSHGKYPGQGLEIAAAGGDGGVWGTFPLVPWKVPALVQAFSFLFKRTTYAQHGARFQDRVCALRTQPARSPGAKAFSEQVLLPWKAQGLPYRLPSRAEQGQSAAL